MAYSTPWPRPYPKISGAPLRDIKRLTVELPLSDAQAIISVACNPAIFSLICQTALKSAATYVRDNKLTYPDQQLLIEHICGRSNPSTPREVPAHDDAGRTESVLDGVTNPPEIPTSTGKKAPSGSGRGVDNNREKIRQAVARVKAKSGRHDEGDGDVAP